jgi:hypothetical protein
VGYPWPMPNMGTILNVQLRSGELLVFGQPFQSAQGGVPYQGRVIGIWHVVPNEFEPEHYDVLAVPEPFFQTFISITQGVQVEAAMNKLIADSQAMATQTKQMPSAMRRRVFTDKDSLVAFDDATLSIQEALTHFNDRRLAALLAYNDDEGDDEDDEDEAKADGAPQANGASVQTQAPAQAPAPVAPQGA